ncbi:MAG: hypothetical protein ACO3IB_02690, partial [Phycisphaerales bacterium]
SDSGILVVRIAPAPVAAAQPSVTAAPARPAVSAQVLAGPTQQPASPASLRSAPSPSSPASDASPRLAGMSVTDAALTSRVRALEAKNRFLLAVTALCFVTAVLLGIVFLASAKSRDEAVASARKEGAESVRAEFERRRPVTESAKAPLPDAPEPPASGAAPPGS